MAATFPKPLFLSGSRLLPTRISWSRCDLSPSAAEDSGWLSEPEGTLPACQCFSFSVFALVPRLRDSGSVCPSGSKPPLARKAKATYVFVVITLDKNRAVGGVLLTLLAERHRLIEAMSVLGRAHGKALGFSWQELGASEAEDTALYDAWLEHRGLATALEAVDREIHGIRHGDFSLA